MRPAFPSRSRAAQAAGWPYAVVPLLGLLLVLPLLRNGPSCGHDFGFHMQSWMDASAQMRTGVLLPHWAFSPAFNAGEPRFVFYPPLSWLLGSVLLLLLPSAVVPAAFTWCALALSGWGMLALARRFTRSTGALLAATCYLVEPYMLFTAFERTAYAELLAAAWMPWLLRALLDERPRVLAVAVPLALLWLTNAPAAVMGTYTLATIALLRFAVRWLRARRRNGSVQDGSQGQTVGLAWGAFSSVILPCTGGLVLGLALAGFYLLPAAWERRYVQIAMAIIPNMRVEDNFLFAKTGYGPHDQVLRTASLVAVAVMGLSAAVLGAMLLRSRLARGPQMYAHRPGREQRLALIVLAALIGVLQFHATLPVWHGLPELAFLQFPWRWMTVLGCVFAIGIAVLLGGARIPPWPGLGVALLLCGVAAPVALRPFREGCEAHELPAERVALFRSHHGVGPTDEYTPGDADNDQLRWDDPAWWLASTPSAPGPGTVPNPAATIVNYDEPPPLDQTVSGRAPDHLTLRLAHPADLILNLRDYPAWRVELNGRPAPRIERDDGIMALALPAGLDTITVRWQRLPDVLLGDCLSGGALAIAAVLWFRSRRIKAVAHDC